MLIKCCNPECQAPFNYRQGRLVRFCRSSANGKRAGSHPVIEHYWLCGQCARLFVFDHEPGTGVRIKPRDQELSKNHLVRSASAA